MPDALDYREILRAVPDTVFVVDADARILWVNNLLPGFSEAEVLGQSSLRWVHPDHQADYLARLDRLLQGGDVEVYDIRSEAPNRDGYHWYHVRMRRLADGAGPPRIVVLSTDVTERKRLEAQREALLGDLQHALAQLDAMQALLPLCTGCRRVRLEADRWLRLDEATAAASAELPARTLCPACTDRQFPDL